MNLLVIGGTGVLSSAVVKESLSRGIHVTMINRGNNRNMFSKDIELLVSDKNNKERIRNYLNGRYFDAIIDFLCVSKKDTIESISFYSEFTKQYIFISSCAVYNTSLGGTFQEDSPKVLPVWDYSVHKWDSEISLMDIASTLGIKYTIVRPCVTYGDTRIPYGISPDYGYHWTLVARILNNKPLIRWNKGRNRCNIMRVEDFAVGVVGLIGNSKAYNEAFNICGDETPSWQDVLDCISKVLNKKIDIVDVSSEFYAQEIPERAGEILGGRSIDAINSNKKLKEVVPEFACHISLYEGIQHTIEAYQQQNFQKGIDWHFEGQTDRIIRKWYKIQGKSIKLGFVDYLQTATIKDKAKYYLELYKDNFFIKTLFFIKMKLRIVKHVFTK